MSRPAMSPMVNGPIARPHFWAAASTCCGVAPSSSRNRLCWPYFSIMRLPMKPSHTPETTGTFFSALPSFMVVASTSLAVFLPRTTSSSRMTLAGEKKCVPITSCGRLVASAILSTSSVEVLDARMAPGFAIAKPGAILASNTSTLDVDKIAEATKRPQDVIGTHFFSPANVMRLLEVVRGKKTAKDVLATTMKLGKALKKVPVVSGVCDGFIGNRMIEKYGQQSLFLLDEGATPQQVDAAAQKWGLAMGPFTMGDMAGLDIGWEIRKRRYQERPDFVYSKVGDRIAEAGRFGQKTGKGWYR